MDYSTLILNGVVRILSSDPETLSRRLSHSIDVSLHPQWLEVCYDDDADLAQKLCVLRDAGVAFLGGAGWPPGAIFEDLRDRGLVDGLYTEVTWMGPDEPVLRQA